MNVDVPCCPTEVHEELKSSPHRVRTETIVVGVQRLSADYVLYLRKLPLWRHASAGVRRGTRSATRPATIVSVSLRTLSDDLSADLLGATTSCHGAVTAIGETIGAGAHDGGHAHDALALQ